MKWPDAGRQSEFISVQSGGDREMKPASVHPHRKGVSHYQHSITDNHARTEGVVVVEQLGPMGVHAYF